MGRLLLTVFLALGVAASASAGSLKKGRPTARLASVPTTAAKSNKK